MANNHTQKRSVGVSRRAFLGGVLSAGALAGTALVPIKSARAGSDLENDAQPNPIPGRLRRSDDPCECFAGPYDTATRDALEQQ